MIQSEINQQTKLKKIKSLKSGNQIYLDKQTNNSNKRTQKVP